MIKAIMAIDDNGGVSRNGSMPWPKNSSDLKWFKKKTLDSVVIMGRLTWIDPFMPTPLKDRINVLVTNQNEENYSGADEYIAGNIIDNVLELSNKYTNKDIYIIIYILYLLIFYKISTVKTFAPKFIASIFFSIQISIL